MKLLTLNCWFNNHKLEERITRISEIIIDKNPDIVCLQEVTEYMYKYIYDRLKNIYNCDITMWPTKCHHQNVIFSKYPIISTNIMPLESKQHKKANIINVEINKIKIKIINIHLEAENERSAIRQMCNILATTNSDQNVILCGDTNISSEDTELPSEWCDIWKSIGTIDNKYTYDSQNNSFIKDTYRSRLDRIYIKGTKCVANKIDMIKEQVSDHYGLVVDIDVK